MTYKLHKQFNWKSSGARLRKPMSDDDRSLQMRNKLQAILAKSKVGPKLTIVKDSDGNVVEWMSDSGWKQVSQKLPKEV